MSGWRKFERRLRPFAIPNLTWILIVGQVVAFILGMAKEGFADAITLKPHAVAAGEWWRLFTFIVDPTTRNPLFLLCGLMFLNLIGTALEAHLGTVRYNLFILISYLSTIAVAALRGNDAPADFVVTNGFIYGSLFLGFAWLYPEFEILVMFILPVKVKWLALITVLFFVFDFSNALSTFAQGGWRECFVILAANLNLLIFFGRDFYLRLRSGQTRMVRQVQQIQEARKPRHVCVICGANNLTHPQCDFRYCPQCAGTPAYCEEHLRGHEHIMKNDVPEKSPL